MSKIDRAFVVLCLLLGGMILWLPRLGSVRPVPLLKPLNEFPRQIGGFTMVEAEKFDRKVRELAGMNDYIMWQYRDRDGYMLSLYIGYYRDQTEGSIIHSPKHCMPGSGWEPVQSGVVAVDGARVNRMLLQKGMEKQLAYYWFQGRGRIVASEYLDRAYMILDSLLRRRSDGALVRIIGNASDVKLAESKQVGFMKALLPVLDGFLPQ